MLSLPAHPPLLTGTLKAQRQLQGSLPSLPLMPAVLVGREDPYLNPFQPSRLLSLKLRVTKKLGVKLEQGEAFGTCPAFFSSFHSDFCSPK